MLLVRPAVHLFADQVDCVVPARGHDLHRARVLHSLNLRHPILPLVSHLSQSVESAQQLSPGSLNAC